MKTLKQTLALIAIAASTLTGAHAESPNDYAYLILRSDQDGQSDCVMREKGHARLKNPILIAGKSYNEDQCTVAMSAKDFAKQFQMCTLTAMDTQNASGAECDFSTANHGEVIEFTSGAGIFKIRGDMPAEVRCVFACKLQSAKK